MHRLFHRMMDKDAGLPRKGLQIPDATMPRGEVRTGIIAGWCDNPVGQNVWIWPTVGIGSGDNNTRAVPSSYLVSLWSVWRRRKGLYFRSSIRTGSFLLFFVVV